MRTRLTIVLLAAGIVPWSAAGCALRDSGGGPSADRPTCAHPAKHQLGFVQAAGGPWPSVRSAGGEVYVGVRGLEQDTILGPIRQTRMSLVDAGQEPQFREDTSVVLNATVTGVVHMGGLTKVRVPAGGYRVVSSNTGNLWIESCTDGLVSDVQVAQPATDAGQP